MRHRLATRQAPEAGSGALPDHRPSPARLLRAARLPRPRAWRIHIGAHKTATTHLQYMLRAQAVALRAGGVDILTFEEVRPVLQYLLARRHWSLRLPDALYRRQLALLLATQHSGAPTVALSEENILGTAAGALREPVYPLLEERLSRLMLLGRGARISLFLSIRSFDRLLPAAYAEDLKSRALERALLDRFIDAAAPRWVDVVERIRRTAPDAPLTIWRQEDYRAHGHAIREAFVGQPLAAGEDIAPPTFTVSPSARGVALAEACALPPSGERRAGVLRLFAENPVVGREDRFAPFPAATVERMLERYAADAEEIERRWPGTMLRFPA